MRIGIIGAGMAGLACADILVAGGARVALFDKGRRAGGRMSTRHVETSAGRASFDYGAQYFTAHSDSFAACVHRWHAQGLAARWPVAGPEAWVGLPGMSAMIGHMADGHDVTFDCLIKGLVRDAAGWHCVTDNEEHGPFDTVVLAIPAEQAASILLLHDLALARVALAAPSQPCWTAMFAFDAALDTPGPIFRDRGIIGWAARNSAKPGRSGPESWVVQANAPWSASHVEESAEAIAPRLLDALAELAGHALPAPVFARAHRWRYARSAAMGQACLWNESLSLGLCGDWLLGPRVECAWLSGTAIGQRVLASSKVS